MPIRIVKGQAGDENDQGIIYNLPPADPTIEQKPEGISFCLIMKNEERFLENCLRSIADVVDEICIVDTGSTDRSIEIAEKFGARIEYHTWQNDFAWARNKSLAMAKYRWIFTMDADEELTEDSRAALRNISNAPAGTYACCVRITNAFDDAVTGDGTFSHYLPRLFPNSPRIGYKGAVHERLVVDMENSTEMVDSPVAIFHHGYKDDVVQGRNKFDRNFPLIKKEAEMYPDDMFCLFNLGMAEVSISAYEDGIQTLERMFALRKKKAMERVIAYFPAAYIALATAYFRHAKDRKRAIELVDECLELTPMHPNALFLRADFHRMDGEVEECRECLKKAVESQDITRSYAFVDDEIPLWKAKFNLAVSYLNEKNYDESFTWFDRALLGKPNSWDVRVTYASALEQAGRGADAERAYESLYRDFSQDSAFWENIRFLIRRQRYVKAIEVINRHIDSIGDDLKVQTLIMAASITHKLGFGEAETYLKRALDIDPQPSRGDAIRLLDDLYLELGRTQERDELRAWEIEVQPPCVTENDFTRRSHRFLEERAFELAADVANAGLKIAPHNPHLLYNAAAAEIQINMVGDAIEHLTALEPFPERDVYLQGTYMRALLLRQVGRTDEALTALDQLLNVDEKSVDAQLFKASLLEALDRTEDAIATLSDMLKDAPERAGLELSTLYLRLGRLDDATRVADDTLSVLATAAR